MEALTPGERRGALVVVCLLALGAGHDLWRAGRPLPTPVQGRVDPSAAAAAPIRAGGAGDTIGPGAPARPPLRLDLNRATAAELDALPGIGPVLAARIVAHREQHGPFLSPEELMAVRGIGPRSFHRIAALLTAGPSAAPADTLPGRTR